MDKHKQINESILLGYFTGTLSIPLQQEVEDWISASEENKKIAPMEHTRPKNERNAYLR